MQSPPNKGKLIPARLKEDSMVVTTLDLADRRTRLRHDRAILHDVMSVRRRRYCPPMFQF